MDFHLEDLRLFAVVADTGNLTQAARRFHLSLAAVSARIKSLEAQAERPLLHREARGVRLTAAGEVFLEHALSILREAERLRDDLHADAAVEGELVRVFAIATAVTEFLPQVLPAFLARHPTASVDVQERPNADIARGVFENRADLGIAAGNVSRFALEAVRFRTEQLVLVVPRGHRLAERPAVSFEELRGEDLVGLHQGSTLQLRVAQEAERVNMRLRFRLQIGSYEVMCRMIAEGVGVGIVPDSTSRRLAATLPISCVELAEPWAIRERYLLMRSMDALSPAAQALVAELRDAFPGDPVPVGDGVGATVADS